MNLGGKDHFLPQTHYDPKVLDHTKLIGLLEKTGDFDHFQAKTPDDVLEEAAEAD